jgi:hypothetical protein
VEGIFDEYLRDRERFTDLGTGSPESELLEVGPA